MIFRFISPVIILAYFIVSASHALGQVGIVIDCFGKCEQETKGYSRNLTSGRSVNVSQMLSTGENSSLWIFLYDGSLLRMAARTILEIKELSLNLSEKKSHVAAQIHQGHAFFLPRTRSFTNYVSDSFRELFPLADYGANPFWDLYEFNEVQPEIEMSMKSKKFIEFRKNELVKKIDHNNKWFSITENLYTLFSPNIVIQTKNRPIDILYSLGYGAVVGTRDDIAGIEFSKNKSSFYLALDQYKKGVFTPNSWYHVVDNKRVKRLINDLGVKEYGIYLKSFPSLLKARERFLEKSLKKITSYSKTDNINKKSENFLLAIQKQPFNFKASVQKTATNNSLVSIFNEHLISLNRTKKPVLKEASLLKIFETTNKQKRSWLLKKELKDIREKNRKILSDFGKPKS